MSKILLVITVLVLFCGLVLGSTVSAMAQETEETAEPRGLFGTVVKVTIVDQDGNGSITLEDAESVNVNSDTRYHIPTFVPPWQTWGELSDEGREFYVEGADRVAILLAEPMAEPASERIALKVMVIPQHPVHSHQVGVVVSVDGDTVTIVNKAGQEVTITLPEGVELTPGEFVTLVAGRFANQVRLRALAAHEIKQLANRLRNHMEAAQGPKDFGRLSTLLERAYERHMMVMERIKAKFEKRYPGQTEAIEAIEQAIENWKTNRENALQRMEQIRDRIRAGWEKWKAQWGKIGGTITSVDLDEQTVTIAPEEGTPVTLEVTEFTLVVKDGRPVPVADLAEDDVVREAIYSKETLEKEILEAQLIVVGTPKWEERWSEVSGTIESIDLNGQTVTITSTEGDTVTVQVVATTRIVKDGKLATLDDLKPDDIVRKAIYFTDTLKAKCIVVGTPKPRHGRH